MGFSALSLPVSEFSKVGPRQFLERCIGPVYAQRYFDVPNSVNMMRNGMRLAQDFAYCVEWKEPELLAKHVGKAKVGPREAAINMILQAQEVHDFNQLRWAEPPPAAPRRRARPAVPIVQPFEPQEIEEDDIQFVEVNDEDQEF